MQQYPKFPPPSIFLQNSLKMHGSFKNDVGTKGLMVNLLGLQYHLCEAQEPLSCLVLGAQSFIFDVQHLLKLIKGLFYLHPIIDQRLGNMNLSLLR